LGRACEVCQPKARSNKTASKAAESWLIAFVCLFLRHNHTIMGKGDKKSKKGKIFMGSNGNSRPAKAKNEATKIQNPKTAE